MLPVVWLRDLASSVPARRSWGIVKWWIIKGASGMSITLLVLFAIAMLAAVIGKFTVAGAGVANVTCLCLLIVFAVLTRIQGVRKPVV
jgi:hypothetical protein